MNFKIRSRFSGNMTIGKKLIGSFLIIAFLLAITAAISSYYLQKIDTAGTDLIERRAIILSNTLKIQVVVSKENSLLRGYMITKDPFFLDSLNTSYDNFNSLVEATQQLARVKEYREELQLLTTSNQEFKLKYEQLLQMIQDNQPSNKTTDYFISEVLPLGRQLDPIADKLAAYQLKSMSEESNKNTQLVNKAITNVATLSIFSFLLAILIGYFSSRMISKPIAAITRVAEQIALGDLTIQEVQVKNKDEIGILARSFTQMTDNLRYVVRQINMSSEHVAAASEELKANAEESSLVSESITLIIQEVNANAEMQSQSVDEIVHTMNDMSSGVDQIASSAQMTSSLSIETAQKASEGNQSLQLTIKQMDSIHQTMAHLAIAVTEMEGHSTEIELIVDVITEIAAQTNLLSLNAAIEAARAGEQGRGFAVVAAEVRKLAEQSSQSAAQIAQLVATIKHRTHHVVETTGLGVKEVSDGIQVVGTAGRLFEEIKRNIDEVSNQVQEISAASEQISASTEQAVHSIANIADGSKAVAAQSQNVVASTEEQLAAMEEIASSASSLSTLAEELKHVVGKFKL